MSQTIRRLFDRPYLLLPLAPLFWSGNFILGRAVRTALPPIGLAFWRWVVATLLIAMIARRHVRRDWPIILTQWRIIVLLGCLGIAAFNTLAYSGLRFTTAINGVLMQSAMPVMIIGMSYLLFRETITRFHVLGLLCSLSGVVTIITRGEWGMLLKLSLNIGDVIILAAVLCYAAYSALLRKRPAIHPLSFLAAIFAVGTCALFPLYLWEHTQQQAMPFTHITLLAVGYVAIFPSIVAYFCFNRGVELVGANRAGFFIHLMPVFGSTLAILLLGETFEWFHGVGILLIITGIFLATRLARR